MATRFVFNPFTGNFDAVGTTTWADLECGIPAHLENGRPIVLAGDGTLMTADMVLTLQNKCHITTLSGDTVYAGTPYSP